MLEPISKKFVACTAWHSPWGRTKIQVYFASCVHLSSSWFIIIYAYQSLSTLVERNICCYTFNQLGITLHLKCVWERIDITDPQSGSLTGLHTRFSNFRAFHSTTFVPDCFQFSTRAPRPVIELFLKQNGTIREHFMYSSAFIRLAKVLSCTPI